MRQSQKGTTTVEFAIIGTALFIVLFGVIEVARVLFVWNTFTESTRRGARVAAVCPVNHSAIGRVAVFGDPSGSGTTSPILNGLSTANIGVSYLGQNGNPTAVFTNIRYVRVGIQNYTHTLFIPFVTPTINAPAFNTTVPVESLGYIPELNTRACFGSPT